MKRWILIFLSCMLLCSIAACGNTAGLDAAESAAAQKEEMLQRKRSEPSAADHEVLVITEEQFSQQIEFIYFNPTAYVGRVIQYEGIFDYYEASDGTPLAQVFRYGTGDGHDHGDVGFEVLYDGDFPEQGAWVQVTGEVVYVTHDGLQYLALELSDLTVLEERGAETVS